MPPSISGRDRPPEPTATNRPVVAVIGPTTLTVGGRSHPLPTGQAWVVLQQLLLRPHQPVPAETIIDVLWSEVPVARARRRLQGVISRLRRNLPPGSIDGDAQSGYRLADDITVDSVEFEQLVGRARDGDEDAAAAARRLWRGTPYADFDDSHLRRAARLRLTDLFADLVASDGRSEHGRSEDGWSIDVEVDPIVRARLLERLPTSGDGAFVAITAPTGYGKSTILRQWSAHLPARAAWVELDPGHDDPTRLGMAIHDALSRTLHASTHHHPGDRLLRTVERAIGNRPPTVIVLDGLHHLGQADVLDELGQLISASIVTVAVASRSPLPSVIGRLIPATDSVLLTEDELALSPAEATDLLQRTATMAPLDPGSYEWIAEWIIDVTAGVPADTVRLLTTMERIVRRSRASQVDAIDRWYDVLSRLDRLRPRVTGIAAPRASTTPTSPELAASIREALSEGDFATIEHWARTVVLDHRITAETRATAAVAVASLEPARRHGWSGERDLDPAVRSAAHAVRAADLARAGRTAASRAAVAESRRLLTPGSPSAATVVLLAMVAATTELIDDGSISDDGMRQLRTAPVMSGAPWLTRSVFGLIALDTLLDGDTEFAEAMLRHAERREPEYRPIVLPPDDVYGALTQTLLSVSSDATNTAAMSIRSIDDLAKRSDECGWTVIAELCRVALMALPQGTVLPRTDGPEAAGHALARRIDAFLERRTEIADDAARLATLSERERLVLERLASEHTITEIAASLFVSVHTVRSQTRSIYRKLGVTSRNAAVAVRHRAAGAGRISDEVDDGHGPA